MILILMDKCMMMVLFVVKFVVVMLEMMVVMFWCKGSVGLCVSGVMAEWRRCRRCGFCC